MIAEGAASFGVGCCLVVGLVLWRGCCDIPKDEDKWRQALWHCVPRPSWVLYLDTMSLMHTTDIFYTFLLPELESGIEISYIL